MANAFSTLGATPNNPVDFNKLTYGGAKGNALSSVLGGIIKKPAIQTLTTQPTQTVQQPVQQTQPSTVKHVITYQNPNPTPTPTTSGMIGQINSSPQIPTTPTPQPSTPTTPPAPPTYSGLVSNLAQTSSQPSQYYNQAQQQLINQSSQPNEDYKRYQQQSEDYSNQAAEVRGYNKIRENQIRANPEYSLDTGTGLGNLINQNTTARMAELNAKASEAGKRADRALSSQGVQQSGLGTSIGAANTQQGLQQSGLGTAAGYLAPHQVPYSNQFVNPVTGQPVGGGTSGSLNDAVSNVVQKLQSGQMTYNDATNALSGYGQGGINALQSALPQGFNISQSNTLGGIQGTVGPAYDYADTALKNVETLMSQLPSIQNTNTPAINNVTRGFSTLTGIGSEGTRAVTGAVNTLRNAYASLLASSKGGTPTDYSGQALAEIPDNPTTNDISALRKNFETLGQARKDIYGNAGGSTNTSSGNIGETVTAGGYGFKLVNGKWVPN